MREGQDPADEAFRDFERSAFEEIADGYRDFFSNVTLHAVDPLLQAAMPIAGGRVLDVATGTGVVARRAVSLGASLVVGIDLTPRMIEIARATCPGVEFRQADAEDLPFPDGSFDAVVCNFGIAHFPKPERAMAEFARVTAPGGAVALSWWDSPARNRLSGIFHDAMEQAGVGLPPDFPAGPLVSRFSDEEQLQSLVKSAGLTAVTLRSFCCTHLLTSPDQLWNGVLRGTVRTGIGIRRQAKPVQDRVRAEFDRLIQPYLDEDGAARVPLAFKIASGVSRRARA